MSHEYNLVDHNEQFTDHIEGVGPVKTEIPIKMTSLFDTILMICVQNCGCRQRRYNQIRYAFRTIFDFWFFASFIMFIVLFVR